MHRGARSVCAFCRTHPLASNARRRANWWMIGLHGTRVVIINEQVLTLQREDALALAKIITAAFE